MAKAAQNKTQATPVPVEQFLAGVADECKREDARTLIKLMSAVSGEPPVMWGPSIIGFGHNHYKYESGREGDICAIGFSPRKDALTLYVLEGSPREASLLARLGPRKTGKGCLYIKRLEDVDMTVLEELVRLAYTSVMARQEGTCKAG